MSAAALLAQADELETQAAELRARAAALAAQERQAARLRAMNDLSARYIDAKGEAREVLNLPKCECLILVSEMRADDDMR